MTEDTAENGNFGPGAFLKQAREQQGISIKDVASRLKLMEQSIHNIESDNYEDTPIAFYKGYLKNYAQFLGLDPEQVAEKFNRYAVKQGLEVDPVTRPSYSAETISRKNSQRYARLFVKLISWLIALALIYSVYYLLAEKGYWNKFINSFDKNPTQEQPLETDDNEGELIPEVSALGSANDDQKLSLEKIDRDTQADSGNELALNLEPAEAETTLQESSGSNFEMADHNAEATEYRMATNDQELLLQFSDECWLQVIDASGKILVSGTKHAGHVSRVSGRAPYRLTIGKVAAIKIEYQGKEIDLSSYPDGRIAKLIIGA